MNTPAEICTLVVEYQTGVRRLAGTDFAVVNQIHRVQKRSGRVIWRVTRDLCNGVSSGAKDYRTKREALESDDGLARIVSLLRLENKVRR